mmetsp:Transcript_61176/g.165014  ORF Transcript_61176/g.165014 Transcript_61176/m.165014 type:complete len:262 (-) Transcript_61176:3-788(-)
MVHHVHSCPGVLQRRPRVGVVLRGDHRLEPAGLRGGDPGVGAAHGARGLRAAAQARRRGLRVHQRDLGHLPGPFGRPVPLGPLGVLLRHAAGVQSPTGVLVADDATPHLAVVPVDDGTHAVGRSPQGIDSSRVFYSQRVAGVVLLGLGVRQLDEVLVVVLVVVIAICCCGLRDLPLPSLANRLLLDHPPRLQEPRGPAIPLDLAPDLALEANYRRADADHWLRCLRLRLGAWRLRLLLRLRLGDRRRHGPTAAGEVGAKMA